MPDPAGDRVYDELISLFYEAAAGKMTWQDALTPLATHLDAWAVQIVSYDKRNGTTLVDHCAGAVPLAARLVHLRTYDRLSPRTPLVRKLGPGQWLHCHEVFDEHFVATDPFYQEYLLPYGGRYLSATHVIDDEVSTTVLVVQRGLGRQPISAAEVVNLDRLRMHLARALESSNQQRVNNTELQAGRELLEQFRFATLLVDSDCNIRFANLAARDMLGQRAFFQELQGRLVCRNDDDQLALARLIDSVDLARPADADPAVDRGGFQRVRDPATGDAVGIFVMPMRVRNTSGAFGAQALAMLAVHDPRARHPLNPAVVAEAFGLTRAEALVAVHLSNGLTPEQIASEKTVAVATVRTQIKSLFLKTGTSRQADLVRLLASLPPVG